MQLVRRTHLVIAWALVAGVVTQVFLAGMGVFDSPTRFSTHATWGYLLELLPLLLLVLAAAGRLGRRQVLYALAIFGMFILQSILIAFRTDMPAVAALHPVNGFGILLLSILQARDAWAARGVVATAPAGMPEPATGAVGR